jgi:hypothetical protein
MLGEINRSAYGLVIFTGVTGFGRTDFYVERVCFGWDGFEITKDIVSR